MVQLNRSMMEKYEIADRRPEKIRALIIGADPLMLGCVARLLDDAGVGAACITHKADALAPQDGMFTLLVRGETLEGKRIREERVIQSIMQVLHPEDTAALQAIAPEIEVIFCRADMPAALAPAALAIRARLENGLDAPRILLVTENSMEAPEAGQLALAETLCGNLSDAEAANARREMNYRDDFIAWAEPYIRLTVDGEAPACIAGVCSGLDFADVCRKKNRVFDAAVNLCATGGYLAGRKNFADALKDETLRAWIGHSFFDEILPTLPYARDEISQDVISAFERLENPMIDLPLVDGNRPLMSAFARSILPSIRAFADENFESPAGLSFALAATIMLYAGARREEDGCYYVARGNEKHRIFDNAEILEACAQLSHDMPAETLAYAALADRDLWGGDLREIDGLEMRVAYDLSAIQRIGFAEALKRRMDAGA